MEEIIQKKICMLGDFSVGKTSLVQRFVYNRFSDQYLSTIGVNISRKELTLGEKNIRLIVWDIAMIEKFNGSHLNYIQGSSGALLICDLTRPETLRNLDNYLALLKKNAPGCNGIIIGNKSDLVKEGSMKNELESVASGMGLPHEMTSAKTGVGVESAFLTIAERMCCA